MKARLLDILATLAFALFLVLGAAGCLLALAIWSVVAGVCDACRRWWRDE